MSEAVLRAGDYEAVFLPQLGMLGTSVTYRGAELLSLRGGLDSYRDGHTVGLPLLAPWANRVSETRFSVLGRDVDLDGLPVLHLDGNRLPIHGTMTAQPGWEVVSLEEARLVARFAYDTRELLAAFPFPHELGIDARLSAGGLEVETSVTPPGGPVPVSFGWHPYFRADRASDELALPERRRLVLDDRGIPTGTEEPLPAERAPLADRTFDDLYALGPDRTFTLGRLELRFDEGYPYLQLFAPPGSDFVAIEPMTAPTNALVTGAFPVAESCFSAAFSISAAS